MNIQIIGTNKCSETRKAQRFFSDRKVQFHFRDLLEKGLAEGELNNILLKCPEEELLDREGKQFAKRQLQHMIFNTKDELLADPLLLRTPIVRNGKEVTVGYQPDVWKAWLQAQ